MAARHHWAIDGPCLRRALAVYLPRGRRAWWFTAGDPRWKAVPDLAAARLIVVLARLSRAKSRGFYDHAGKVVAC